MKFRGSAQVLIECVECLKQSPQFRVYLFDEDDDYQWDGKPPDGWTIKEEAELFPNENVNLPFIVLGNCPEHPEKEELAKELSNGKE